MNIKEAKEQIKNAMTAYFTKDKFGNYGCKEYFNHNKELLFYERQKKIIAELEKLELEE